MMGRSSSVLVRSFGYQCDVQGQIFGPVACFNASYPFMNMQEIHKRGHCEDVTAVLATVFYTVCQTKP